MRNEYFKQIIIAYNDFFKKINLTYYRYKRSPVELFFIFTIRNIKS